MTQLLDRNRLYALLGALEDDLRELIRTHLLDLADDRELLGSAYDKAAERFIDDTDAMNAGADIFDYLDLGDEIAIINRHRASLPPGIRDAFSASARRLDDLVGIRNRVMHRRPLLPDDHDNAARWLGELHDGGFVGQSLKTTLRQLRNANWSPVTSYVNAPAAAVINNLPLPDFDDTGLIGRRKQVESIKKLIVNRRFPVITLIGPGGVGKTALALQVLHEMADDVESPYDLIAWVSMKTEQLTSSGVQNIRDAVRSLEDAIPSLASPLDESFSGGVTDLAKSLEGIDAVLAIDNLETVSAAEVVALVDELPSTVTCLFTSRVGMGEIERRNVVGPLDMSYGVDLFRRLCRSRHIEHLAVLPEQRIVEVLTLLGTSPLAIKWFVLAVEAGQTPETILKQQTDLIRFCVRNVYQGLSEESKDAAVVLAHVARPLTVQDMKLYFPGTTPDELRRSVQELLRRSLCTVSILDESLAELFQATDALVEYLRIIGGASSDFLNRVQRTEDEYRLAEERLRLERGRAPLRVNVIDGTSEHRASALRLRDALAASAQGAIPEALHIIDEVEQLEPEYWELFRVRGFILGHQRHVEEATLAYERALALAPAGESKARVQFFFAGHMMRRTRNSEKAVEYARAAHQFFDRHESAIELGKALTYVRDFTAALEVLKFACGSADLKGQLIAGTQLIDTMRRRAEVEADELRSPSVALSTLSEALTEGQQLLMGGIRDKRLEEGLFKCVADLTRFASWLPEGADRDDKLRHGFAALGLLSPDAGGRHRRHLINHATKLLAANALPDDVVDQLKAIANSDVSDDEEIVAPEVPVGSFLLGTIKTWKAEKKFGFITSIDGSKDYFFHADDLERPRDQILLARGVAVEFTVAMSQTGIRAAAVALREPGDADLLKRRTLTVRSVSPRFLLARDDQSGTTIFVNRQAFSDDAQWSLVHEGSKIVADVESLHSDRFNAAKGSVTVA
jgi:LuxR family transcriptional regulator, glucitol operon activator